LGQHEDADDMKPPWQKTVPHFAMSGPSDRFLSLSKNPRDMHCEIVVNHCAFVVNTCNASVWSTQCFSGLTQPAEKRKSAAEKITEKCKPYKSVAHA
jgi:hypothetical protein